MPKRILQGKVVSHTDKTANVIVSRSVVHSRYKKIVKRSKPYLVHDESNSAKVGDIVNFIESAPFSKRKCWQLI